MFTTKIDEDTLKKIIKSHVEKKTGLKVKSISFNVGTRTVGYYTDERDESYFNGATIEFEQDLLDLGVDE